jgi:hypothetical protein
VREALSELEFWVPTGDDETLEPLGDSHDSHQTWGLARAAPAWRIDVFREPSRDGRWVCRRDERITLPYDELIERTPDGVPYVRPEVALLFKAKAARDKDEVDFEAVLPRLEASRRALLAGWLECVHPGHPWLQRLTSASGRGSART